MTEPSHQPDEQVQAFLRELVDEYGVEGLTERFAAAIQDAEAGRVTGSALDEATVWVEQEHGQHLQAIGVATGFFGWTGAAVGKAPETSQVALAGEVTGVTANIAIEVAGVVQSTAVTLPTNMEVMLLAHDAFLYLCGAWGIVTQMPVEAFPFVLLMTLAIVIVRVRLGQAKGSTEG